VGLPPPTDMGKNLEIEGPREGSHDKRGVTPPPGRGEHQSRREAGDSNAATSRRPSLEFSHHLLSLPIKLYRHVLEGRWTREGIGVCMRQVLNRLLIRPVIAPEHLQNYVNTYVCMYVCMCMYVYKRGCMLRTITLPKTWHDSL
jgi:hypothetical protein